MRSASNKVARSHVFRSEIELGNETISTIVSALVYVQGFCYVLMKLMNTGFPAFRIPAAIV